MKFGKSLSNQIEETLPEWRDKFLSYKELKKRLKLIEPQSAGETRSSKRPRLCFAGDCCGGDASNMTTEESDFLELLEKELEKFNSFFVEKEEDYIIRLKDIKDRAAKAKPFSEEMMKIRKEVVDFHGEMVLLENYSALNYTGLAKILKKYDKRTGALLRSPFIQKVLQQPFFTTDLLYKLVKECETLIDHLFPIVEAPVTSSIDNGSVKTMPDTSENNGIATGGHNEFAEIQYMESLYMKSSISALRALQVIRSKSSTVSIFSLPPLQINGLEETWRKVPVLEQVAK